VFLGVCYIIYKIAQFNDTVIRKKNTFIVN